MHKSSGISKGPNMADTLAMAFGRPLPDSNSYKTMTTQANFSVLAKIVNALKERYLEGCSEPLTIEEILDSVGLQDISKHQRDWLVKEALANNVKVRLVEDSSKQVTRYEFKPILNVKDKNTLRRYLQDQYEAGEGAVSYDDIVESLPRASEKIKSLEKKDLIIVITRTSDKKKYVFFNDARQDIKIDEEFIKLWRTTSVEGVPDEKIEEYLEKHGIQSIKDLASRKMEPVQKRRKISRKPNKNFKAHNEHMKDILEDYSEK